ncbi:MAG: hypothetical protein Tsb005_01060 [Gammaproteobacteria bacterium]
MKFSDINLNELINKFDQYYKLITAASLIIGFGLCISYFLHIDYFPINDMQTSITLFLYAFATCLLMMGSVCFIVFVANYYWYQLVLNVPECCDYVVGRPEFIKIFRAVRRDKLDEADKIVQANTRIMFYYLIFLTLPSLVYYSLFIWNKYICSLILVFCIATVYLYIMRFLDITSNPDVSVFELIKQQLAKPKQKFTSNKVWLKILVASVFASGLLFLALQAIFIFLKIEEVTNLDRFVYMLFILVISSMNLNFPKSTKSIKYSMLLTLILTVVCSSVTSNVVIAETIMSRTTLGAYKTNMEVDTVACNMMRHKNAKIICDKNKSPIAIGAVWLLWRGKNEYYIKFVDNKGKVQKLILNARHIEGLYRIDKH